MSDRKHVFPFSHQPSSSTITIPNMAFSNLASGIDPRVVSLPNAQHGSDLQWPDASSEFDEPPVEFVLRRASSETTLVSAPTPRSRQGLQVPRVARVGRRRHRTSGSALDDHVESSRRSRRPGPFSSAPVSPQDSRSTSPMPFVGFPTHCSRRPAHVRRPSSSWMRTDKPS